jgi:hypothetical protein
VVPGQYRYNGRNEDVRLGTERDFLNYTIQIQEKELGIDNAQLFQVYTNQSFRER